MCKDLQENKNNKMKFHEEIDRFNSRETRILGQLAY